MMVYAFIGVNGSGKGFTLNKFKSNYLNPASIDFSDGVRDYTFSFLGVKPITDKDYEEFKVSESTIVLAGEHKVMGRQFLDNIGKKMCERNPDFWVEYTCNQALNYKDSGAILFGSCRFLKEAKGVLDFAAQVGSGVKFIFCDFRSDKYDDRDLPYQSLALKLRAKGFKNCDDVTSEIKSLLWKT